MFLDQEHGEEGLEEYTISFNTEFISVKSVDTTTTEDLPLGIEFNPLDNEAYFIESVFIILQSATA